VTMPDLAAQFGFNVIDSLPYSVAVLDSQGVIIAVNECWRRFALENSNSSTLTPSDDIGKNYLSVCALVGNGESRSWKRERGETQEGQEREQALAAFAGISAVLKGEKKEFSLEYPCHSADAKRWFMMNVARLKGNQSGAVVSHVEITDRKHSELGLQESELRIRMFIEKAPVAIVMLDKQMRYLSASRRWRIDFGLEKQDILGRSHYDLFPEIPERWREVHRKCLAGATEKSDEDIFIRANGSIEWVRWEINPWTDRFGDIGGIVIFREIITQRKLAEDALKRSEREFHLLAEAVPQIVWIALADSRNIYVNQRWSEYTGLVQEDSYGHGWLKAVHPDDQQKACEAWSSALKDRNIYSYEGRLRRADGQYCWWLVRSIPVLNEHGDVVKWFGTCTDIDRLKQAEIALEEAKNAAETASAAKSQFLAMMSHEIRTPLNAIIGFSQLLIYSDKDQKQIQDQKVWLATKQDYARRIQRNGQLLIHLIDDILDLSKIEAGELKFEKLETLLYEFFSDVKVVMLHKAKEKGFLFTMKVESSLPQSFLTDPMRLKQILFNIIGNAIKFTSQGEVRVEVKRGLNDRLLHIVVEDTGVGLASEQVSKLFQPFTQADSSIHRQFGGTGLGLVVSRRLAQALGGDVVLVRTQPGVGSTFEITVALLASLVDTPKCQLQLTNQAVRAERVPKQPSEALAKIRVLLAEDMLDNQILITKIIGWAGGTVDIAIDGEEAVMMAMVGGYDIVLMDICMPKLDGYAATEKLRSKGYQRPIIALTARAMPDDIRRCEKVGCNAHLAKSVMHNELIELILRHL